MFGINKNILIGAVLVVVLALSLGFRNQVSEFLNFGPDIPPAPEISAEIFPRPEEPGSRPTEVGLETAEKSPKIPAYTGRDPSEIRPVPEEVMVFTEEQKQ